MPRPIATAALLASVSKHDISGVIVIVIGVILLGLAAVRAAIRTALLFVGVIVAVVGVLLVTRTI